jgi:membrane-bound lytic murein transglycosylase D
MTKPFSFLAGGSQDLRFPPIEVEYPDARGIPSRTHYNQAVLIGRGDDCGLRILHSEVSRHHLAIFPE